MMIRVVIVVIKRVRTVNNNKFCQEKVDIVKKTYMHFKSRNILTKISRILISESPLSEYVFSHC